MADIDAVKKLKVAELREELTEKGLNSKGNKQELIDRLTEYIEENAGDTALDNDGTEAENTAPTDEEAGLLEPELEAITTITTEEEAAILDSDPKEDADAVLEEEEKKPVDEDADDAPPKLNPVTPPQEVKKDPEADKETLTAIDKKKQRAERFSQPLTEDAKKAARAQRFGSAAVTPNTTTKATPKAGGIISSISKTAAPEDAAKLEQRLDKLKQRAARFGAVVSPVVEKSEQQARLLKRKERFGANTTTSTTTSGSLDAKKQKRAERFGV